MHLISEILELLQKDCRATADTIAQQVALSPAAVHKRLRKLRDSAAITAEVAVLDPAKFGYHMRVIVEVTLERETLHELEAFKAEMRNSPNVQQCYYTTGDADFILHLLVKDIADYQSFTQVHFLGKKFIRRFESNVVMDVVKTDLMSRWIDQLASQCLCLAQHIRRGQYIPRRTNTAGPDQMPLL